MWERASVTGECGATGEARGEARGEEWDCLFFARRRLRGGDADGNARGVKLTVEGVITD